MGCKENPLKSSPSGTIFQSSLSSFDGCPAPQMLCMVLHHLFLYGVDFSDTFELAIGLWAWYYYMWVLSESPLCTVQWVWMDILTCDSIYPSPNCAYGAVWPWLKMMVMIICIGNFPHTQLSSSAQKTSWNLALGFILWCQQLLTIKVRGCQSLAQQKIPMFPSNVALKL